MSGPGRPVLSNRILGALPAVTHPPMYDRSATRVGIVHVGVGAFHRSHQAMYVDRLMRAGGAAGWGIAGIGLFAAEARTKAAFQAQDGLYTLLLRRSGEPTRTSVIGSLTEYLLATDDPASVVERLAHPRTRVVSLTITEGGYAVDPQSGLFDSSLPGIAADLVPGRPPRSVFGFVTAALAQRRTRGITPFTVMSCDNLQSNGQVARQAFTGFARLKAPDLASWMEDHVTFPNSMVDRITPAPTAAEVQEVAARHGYVDAWPVAAEPFVQWVLEDDFCNGRPALEEVGVQLVSDVAPYETMKLRLLNGAHQLVSYFACLVGYSYVHEACRDPLFARFLEGYLRDEALPTLAPVPGLDLDTYCEQVLARFSNAAIADTVARVCAFSSDRIAKFLVPVVRDQLATGRSASRAAAAVASWARYALGTDEHGRAIEVVDANRDRVMAAARESLERPRAFLEQRDVFGDLADEDRFVEDFTTALEHLRVKGVRRTMEALTEADPDVRRAQQTRPSAASNVDVGFPS